MSTVPAAGVDPLRLSDTPLGRRIATGSALYHEIVEFQLDEAALLDQQRFSEWGDLLDKDLRYTAPLRITRSGPDRMKTVVRTTKHFDDDYGSIMGRIGRLGTKSAWAEDPPSRTRRFVSNTRVWETATANEYEAESYLLLSRSRYEHSELQMLSCVRHDLLRRDASGAFKIARREIIVDQTVVGMANLAVFL